MDLRGFRFLLVGLPARKSAAPAGLTLTPPAPLSPPPSLHDGREGRTTISMIHPLELFLPCSLFSRRSGGRRGEEGRGDEGQPAEDADADKAEVNSPPCSPPSP